MTVKYTVDFLGPGCCSGCSDGSDVDGSDSRGDEACIPTQTI